MSGWPRFEHALQQSRKPARRYRAVSGAILVVEDEPAIQELIAVNLEHAGHTVLRAASVPQAEEHVRNALPDLVLLDCMLPGLSGVSYAKQLRANERTRDVPIIMLTARASEQDKIAGLEAGADDYVTKPFSPKELLARIKAVMRRRAPQLTEDTVAIAGLKLDPVSHRVTGNDVNLDLGPTEFRLLHWFMTHPERVYSRAQLLDEVWGDHVFVEERTVDVHIRRLRQALESTGHDKLIDTVRGTGYRFCRTLPGP
jgi:two-component system phosphate regulon response regulator PhoB